MARRIRDPQSRARIVDAAWRVVADLGVRGATVRAIAAEAGVSTGYVMHYFGDKQQIADAVLEHNNVRAGARVTGAQRGRRGLDALTAAVEALLPLDDERRREWQVWVAFWADAGDDGVRDGLAEGRGVLGAILRAALRQAVDDGELPEGLDLAYETERLLTLAAGLGLFAGAGSPPAVRRTARRMLDDHLGALRARAEELR